VEGFFWPKIFWDFMTKTLDPAVKPIPVLQTINLVFGLILLAWEWPLSFLAGSSLHRSLEARLAFLPMSALAAALIYQGTNAAIYQVIGLGVYFWAYSEGEVSLQCHIALPCCRTTANRKIDDLREAVDSAPADTADCPCLDGQTHTNAPVHIQHGVNTRPPTPPGPFSHDLAISS
jgi:hypothetical protein